MSEFIKKAYEANRVKEVKDVFDELPPEEEWHKGKIEYIIEESKVVYSDTCEIGDIVFVRKYTYDDGKEGTNHFFVIVDYDNIAVPIEYFGMIISSNLDKLKYNTNILLKSYNYNNLDRDSLVKTDVIYKLSKNQIAFKIGKVDIDKVEEYKRRFIKQIDKAKRS